MIMNRISIKPLLEHSVVDNNYPYMKKYKLWTKFSSFFSGRNTNSTLMVVVLVLIAPVGNVKNMIQKTC